MRLREIHIYGFGKFQDYRLTFHGQPIEVILGDNEAGKTTIMSFIKCILFGFPTKTHNELRYEPKQGGRYGGKIEFECEKLGVFTVERTIGKAVGDVKVLFSDGSIGEEIELKKILLEMDRTIFSGIYWFRLNDLQYLEQMKTEEFNQYLYGVGMSGRQSIVQLEKNNEKNLGLAFKPSGKKPHVNVQLKKVIEIEQKVLAWQAKLKNHEDFVHDRDELLTKFKSIRHEIRGIREEEKHLDKLQALKATVLQKRELEVQLEHLPNEGYYPDHGLEKNEKLSSKIIELKAEASELERQYDEVTNEINSVTFTSILEDEQVIQNLKDYCKVYEVKREELRQLLEKKELLEHECTQLKEKLGLDSEYVESDTSFAAERSLTDIIERETELKQYEYALKINLQKTEDTIRRKEKEIDLLNQQLLTDEVRNKYEQLQHNHQTTSNTKQDLDSIQEKMNLIDAQVATISSSWFNKVSLGILCVVALIMTGYFLNDRNYTLGGIFSLITVLAIAHVIRAIITNKKRRNELKEQKSKLKIKQSQLLIKLETLNVGDGGNIQQALLRDDHLRNELALQSTRVKEEKTAYEEANLKFKTWEQQNEQLKQELIDWCAIHKFRSGFPATHYIKLMNIVGELKKKQYEMNQNDRKINELQLVCASEEEKVKNLGLKYNLNYETKWHQQCVEQLWQCLRREKERVILLQRLQDKQAVIKSSLLGVKNKITVYKEEQVKMWAEASVDNEDQFLLKGQAYAERKALQTKMTLLTSQLSSYIQTPEELRLIEEEILQAHLTFDERVKSLTERLNLLIAKEEQINKEIATLQVAIEQLEEGSNYSECLHQFEKEKELLKEELKKWALYKTIQNVISEAKAVYEKERQPLVVQEATKNFAFLTNNEYKMIYSPIGEQQLKVIRRDGEHFIPSELSQGTKEQLYLSLRIALAAVHSKESKFPFFIDDAFVNFDKKRRSQVVKLLHSLTSKHQIIYFTCHSFMAEEVSGQHCRLEKGV